MKHYTLALLFLIFAHLLRAQEKDTLTTAEWFRLQSLTELCDTFPTDKCSDRHGFLEVYEPLFEPMREDSIRFFEIGILTGLSHLMWRNYFPHAEVYGIDLKDYSKVAAKDGIQTFVADQSNRNDLLGFLEFSGGNFDVILDDGGHAMDHQQVSLAYLFPHVKPGGLYIIEDVHSSLPEFYPDPAFKVATAETNTTLLMLERFVRTGKMESAYMSEEEMRFLESYIERIELHYINSPRHSITCVIHRKK